VSKINGVNQLLAGCAGPSMIRVTTCWI